MTKENQNPLGKENADTMDKFHCFGSRWFCLQMQEAFSVQSSILREIAQNYRSPKLKQELPLIHGLHTTSEAISLLRRDGLLNEAHVLMRLLTERALNLCYLLATPSSERSQTPRATSSEATPAQHGPMADELIEFAEGFRFKETYDSEFLETKINAIAANTQIPLGFLRLIVASHYPQASLAISGSPYGAVFHLFGMIEEEEENHFSSNFTALLFGALTLLNHVINTLAAYDIPENLVRDSNASNDAATKLMLKMRQPVALGVRDTYGWWQNLSDHEYFAGKRLASLLREFDIAFGACVEAGMQLPVLAKQEKGSVRLKISALYLKRMLNDVRSVWVMIRQGNTSQAGSIAASLFENALLIQCLAENEARAVKFGKAPRDTWPWSKRAMCNFVDEDRAKMENRKPDTNAADAHYAHYSWLCEIKHASLDYVTHESGSTQFREKGYAIMPFPDIREEDWPVKKKILLISLHNAMMAIQAFARGGAVKETSESEIIFASRVKAANDTIVEYLKHKRGA